MAQIIAAQAAIRILESEGVDAVFARTSDTAPALMAALGDSGVKHHAVHRSEAVVDAAETYARAAPGRIGVCIATSGPGGTDVLPGLFAATASGTPVLCITVQTPGSVLHGGSFNAVDIAALSRPAAKWSKTVMEAHHIPDALREAFRLLRTGRPGAVHIDIPLRVLTANVAVDDRPARPRDLTRDSSSRMAA